jgi:hypothetical protein
MKKMEQEEKGGRRKRRRRKRRKRQDGERTERKEEDERRKDIRQKVTCHDLSNVQYTENHYRINYLASEYLKATVDKTWASYWCGRKRC